MSADLTNPVFTDEEKAREWLEAKRWPEGPVCPHCGSVGGGVKRLEGKASRPGLFQCNGCHGQFSVTIGTLYERSHIPLHKWLLATHLLTSSKKGMSAHQLHRMLGITYKSAWFMCHRIREAMAETDPTTMGGEGKTVEADETYIGGKEKNKHARKRTKGNIGGMGKEIAFSIVERGGKVRSQRIPDASAKTLRPILMANVDQKTSLVSDDAGQYRNMNRDFPLHQTVNHGVGEYVRGATHSNTVEGYFSILKRGIYGTYHHVSPQHLSRYLAEFDFRYNNRIAVGVDDKGRADRALDGIEGKRLMYKELIDRARS